MRRVLPSRTSVREHSSVGITALAVSNLEADTVTSAPMGFRAWV
jgi:hypothetical protein